MSDKIDERELEVWKRLWASRDFELQYFWQRSVFLTAFLVLGITAYGTFQGAFISKIFEGKICSTKNSITIYNAISLDFKCKEIIGIYSAISVFLCSINMILSVLWIMMAKGSKNAYEVYETALDPKSVKCRIKDKTLKEAYVTLDSDNNTNDKDEFILTTKAYRYSVSRINIALSIFSLGIFLFLAILHIILCFCFKVGYLTIFCIVTFFVSIALIYICNANLKS